MSRTKCLIVAAVACFPSAALAQAFTFEDLQPGLYFSISQSVGGQTLTVTPLGDALIVAVDPGVPLLGAVSLFAPSGGSRDPFVPMRFFFLNPVSAVTFAFGDADAADDDSPARIQAFDAFNNLVGVFDTPYPAGKIDGATRALTFGGAGASSFVVSSEVSCDCRAHSNSLFWEVAASTPAGPTTVPEPASVALVGSGLILLGVVYRRREARHRTSGRHHVE